MIFQLSSNQKRSTPTIPFSIPAIANAVFCIERFARLDSSSSAVKNMDERVAKMWMLRYAVGILAILHNNETLCWGLVNDIFTVGLWRERRRIIGRGTFSHSSSFEANLKACFPHCSSLKYEMCDLDV